MRPGLRKALEEQLREYDSIEAETHAIAAQRGWDLPDMDPAARFFSDRVIRMKLAHRNCDSKIADMMIRSNTNSMIMELKNLHQFPNSDQQITILCQKLLDCETANIRQMQRFL